MNALSQRLRAAVAVLLVALAACGGGGEDADDEPAPAPALEKNDPVRDWTFSRYSSSRTGGITRSVVGGQDGSGTQVGGLMEKIAGFGIVGLEEQSLALITETVPPDGQANGTVFSTADGKTYGVFAEAPFGLLATPQTTPIGGNASLLQRQSFIKRSNSASLSFTLTDARICAHDYNLVPPTPGLDDSQTPVRGVTLFSLQAWTGRGEAKRQFFNVAGGAAVVGSKNAWVRFVENFEESFSFVAWEERDFDFVQTPLDDQFGKGTRACLQLNVEITYPIDLSSIGIGEEFTVQSIAEADALNKRGNVNVLDQQASGVHAYLRDPARIGGTAMSFTGLEPTNRPDTAPPIPVAQPPAACLPGPGPDPAAGVLQFSAPAYRTDESPGGLRTVKVTRTGGSRGAVSAILTTADGTATGGTDYTPVNRTVSFRDGETTAKVVDIPVLPDQVLESSETVLLTLSQPGGCAALGAQTTAVLTIDDDELPPLPTTPTGLDTRFDGDGKATLERFGGDRSGMALQADGKIVMVGGTFTDFVMARFNADGSVDRGLGVDGKVTTDMGSGLRQEEALAVAIQADGKIVVAGYTGVDTAPPAPSPPNTFALARYHPDGRLDTTFGVGGRVSGNVNGIARALAIQADGRIVVSGEFDREASSGVFVSDFTVARFNADGSLDRSFGGSGTGQVETDIGGAPNSGRNLLLQPDGKIVVSGNPQCGASGCGQTDVVRYRADGSLDPDFGSGGKVTVAATDVGQGLARQADGKLVLVGTVLQTTAPATSRIVLMRLLADGRPDPAFGTAGTTIATLAENVTAGGLALQADGRIVVAGTRALAPNANFVVARFAGNGAIDGSFGNAGILSIDFFGFTDFGENVLLQPDGRIVVGGLARNDVDGYGLARINP